MQGLPWDADVNLFQWLFADWSWSNNILFCAFCAGFPCESQHQSCEVKHTSLSISCIMGFSETRAASVNQILPVHSQCAGWFWVLEPTPWISQVDHWEWSFWPSWHKQAEEQRIVCLSSGFTSPQVLSVSVWLYVFYSYTLYFKNMILSEVLWLWKTCRLK